MVITRTIASCRFLQKSFSVSLELKSKAEISKKIEKYPNIGVLRFLRLYSTAVRTYIRHRLIIMWTFYSTIHRIQTVQRVVCSFVLHRSVCSKQDSGAHGQQFFLSSSFQYFFFVLCTKLIEFIKVVMQPTSIRTTLFIISIQQCCWRADWNWTKPFL